MELDDATGRSGTPIVVNIQSGKIDGLQKELGGSQEGEENGTGGGGEILNNATIQCLKVMTNPMVMILLNIFSHLEFDALVKLRLVCKLWYEVIRISPEFRNMFWIHVLRLFPCCMVAPVPMVMLNLTNNIYITDKCWSRNREHDEKQTAHAAAYNLTTFFTQYHRYVKNIKFDGQHCDSFHTYLVNALNVLEFPKLQGIVIKDILYLGCSSLWEDYEGDLISKFSTFPTRRNLRSLRLDDTIPGSPFHDIFQKLINCAPKLKEITISGNFYPDLSTCNNIKIIKYSGIPYKDTSCQSEDMSFNLESLSKMLDQVKHSLIKLSLEDSYHEFNSSGSESHSQQEKFKFPDVLKKLEVLCLQENTAWNIFQSGLKKLNPVQFPKLTNLSIVMKSLDDVVGGMSHSFGTISYLRLSGTISKDFKHRIPILFPNLTNLTLPWSVGLGEKPDFDKVIDFCHGWKLQKLDIDTALESDWSAFMAGLGRLKQTQNDMKVLKLPSKNNASLANPKPAFDLWYDAKKEQQQVGAVELRNLAFGPQSMRKALEENVSKFIFEHPLVVHFI